MATGGEVSDLIASAGRKASAARVVSEHESSHAELHELRAGQAPTEVVRDAHRRIAAIHRSTADRHLTAARLHDYVARLPCWSHERGAPQPLFISGVAAACGTSSVAVTLIGATLDQLGLAASDEPSRAAQELEIL
ncbi:MAG: GAF domain-containing protein, partial [Streptomyces sp.]|nr:GAF domain-containing protein [Streptomyces sp.]